MATGTITLVNKPPESHTCTYNTTYIDEVDKNFYVVYGKVVNVCFVGKIKAAIPNNTNIISGFPVYSSAPRIAPYIADNKYLNNAIHGGGAALTSAGIMQFELDSTYVGKWIAYIFTYIAS